MPGPKRNPELLDELALAVALGRSRRSWAKSHDISERTVRMWVKRPEFDGLVAQHRRRINDKVIGRATRYATKAIDKLAKLLDAGSESTQLGAAREILAQLVSINRWSEQDRRFERLEEYMIHRKENEGQ